MCGKKEEKEQRNWNSVPYFGPKRTQAGLSPSIIQSITLLQKNPYLEHARACSHPLCTTALRDMKREKELMSAEELLGGRRCARHGDDKDYSDTVISAQSFVTWPRVICLESFEVGG